MHEVAWLPYVVGMVAAVAGVPVARWLEDTTYRKPDEHEVPWPGSRWWVPVVLAGAGALVTHRVWRTGDPTVPTWPVAVVLSGTLLLVVLSCTCLAAMDLDVHRLPDRIMWPTMAFLAAGQALTALVGGGWEPWVRAMLAGLACGAFYFVVALVCMLGGSLALGLGDVKLAVVLGATLGWFGWSEALSGVYCGFLVGGLWALVLLLLRRVRWGGDFAYGPPMMVGALVGLFWGPALFTGWT